MTAAEEREFARAVEAGEFESLGNIPRRRASLQRAARHTLESDRTRISLRIQTDDLSKLRAIAYARGIPYQTLINSIIHQYAKGNLKEDA